MSDQSHEEGNAAPAAAVAIAVATTATATATATNAAAPSPALVSSTATLLDPTLPTTSRDAVEGGNAGSPMSAIAATGTVTDNPSSEAVTLTGSPSKPPSLSTPPVSPLGLPEPIHAYLPSSSTGVVPSDKDTCTGTAPDANVPSLPLAPAAPTTGASNNHQYHHNHVDPSNKKSRPPLVNHRSSGASLLTQALASARGIPSSQPAQQEQAGHEEKLAQPNEPTQAYRVKNNTNGVRPTPTVTRHDDFLRQTGGSSVTPMSFSLPTEAVTTEALLSQSPPDLRSETDIPTTPAAMSDILHETSLLASHRDFARTFMNGGRSLERTVREMKPSQPGGSEISSGYIKDSSISHLVGDQGNISHTLDRREPLSDSIAQNRPRHTERTMSMGPEKAWSIDTGDVIGIQDGQGQVEKSITEVLAGMEPTRSRKASHSLRFFKEALPNEKGKRKDGRSEKLPPTDEALSEVLFQTHHEGQYPRPSPALPAPRKDLPSPSPVANGQSLPLRTSDTASAASRILGPDYFSLSKNRSENVKPTDKGETGLETPTIKIVSDKGRCDLPTDALASIDGNLQLRRESVDSTEVREQPETGEDSSEEKISSAVFLPHQGLEEPQDIVDSSPPSFHAPHAVHRRSTKESFHPWLVKADGQEAESEEEKNEDDVLNRNVDRIQKVRSFPPDLGDECAIEEDVESSRRTGYSSQISSRPISQYYDEIVHDHQDETEKPLEAIELIPYKHQVGGHTTIWRFSKRAVCKQLNNRENEFYENIERYHRDLLPFLPRYIGVLNVTFQKLPRRRSTAKKDEVPVLDHQPNDQDTRPNGYDGNDERRADQTPKQTCGEGQGHQRIISQSMQSGHVSRPTVTFVDNRHILPRSFLQPVIESDRSRSQSDVTSERYEVGNHSQKLGNGAPPRRPKLEERHANSWGATTVNKRLRNEVFTDAFLKQPVTVQRHQRPASHSRSITHRVIQLEQRPASAYGPANGGNPIEETAEPEKTVPQFAQTQSDLGPKNAFLNLEAFDNVKDITGSSAPEPETLAGQFPPRQRRKRRYSGSGLRRKPLDVNHSDGNYISQSRGNLQYFEDADDGYAAEGEASQITPPPPPDVKSGSGQSQDSAATGTLTMPSISQSGFSSVVTSGLPSPAIEGKKIPRPINPKEARAQQSSRVEYFLLMEDLTSGMKRPCIMDLKMGTRQYGVEASAKKRDSQRRKCASTTSRELGVRVCGLQAWDAKAQTYIFKDKYWGRDLAAGAEFRNALKLFLYDGVDYSSVLRHIPTILQKLNQLEATVRRLRGYRFYAASLLMFYDGDTSVDEYDSTIDDSTTDFPTDTEDSPDMRRRQDTKREIDFKMADFANSVTPGELATDKPCPPRYPDQADSGFLRGLRTLKKCFLRIQRDVRDDLGLITQHRRQSQDLDGMEEDDEALLVSD